MCNISYVFCISKSLMLSDYFQIVFLIATVSYLVLHSLKMMLESVKYEKIEALEVRVWLSVLSLGFCSFEYIILYTFQSVWINSYIFWYTIMLRVMCALNEKSIGLKIFWSHMEIISYREKFNWSMEIQIQFEKSVTVNNTDYF